VDDGQARKRIEPDFDSREPEANSTQPGEARAQSEENPGEPEADSQEALTTKTRSHEEEHSVPDFLRVFVPSWLKAIEQAEPLSTSYE
jgi:hypothetical protein